MLRYSIRPRERRKKESRGSLDTPQEVPKVMCPLFGNGCKYGDDDAVICNEDPTPCPIYQNGAPQTVNEASLRTSEKNE